VWCHSAQSRLAVLQLTSSSGSSVVKNLNTY